MSNDEDTPKIWEKQDDETPRAYALFCLFLQLKLDRSYKELQSLATSVNKFKNTPSIDSIKTYASRHNWKERAAAYDVYIIDKERAELEARAYERRKKRLEQNALAQIQN